PNGGQFGIIEHPVATRRHNRHVRTYDGIRSGNAFAHRPGEQCRQCRAGARRGRGAILIADFSEPARDIFRPWAPDSHEISGRYGKPVFHKEGRAALGTRRGRKLSWYPSPQERVRVSRRHYIGDHADALARGALLDTDMAASPSAA